ncbi:MAG: beta-lactamase family protein [Bryobacteraceae bacterium]|nr:beta-lactamase family protein [Bryobacteraceae bacterium]
MPSRRDILASLFLSAVPARPQSEKISPGLLDRWLSEHRLPGASIAWVSRGGGPAEIAAGVADPESKRQVEPGTIFQAASLSKPVFAYTFLKEAAARKLDLDRPLTAMLDHPFRSRLRALMASEVPEDPRLALITPRMVLSHSTGVPNWLRNQPLALQFRPGEKFGYSGEAYVYLQNVLEHVAGHPLQDLAQRHVFEPLGMRDSSFVWRSDFEHRAAIGSSESGPRHKWRPAEGLAAGTLHTTAADYARFLRRFLRGDEITLQMLKPATQVQDGLAWGLGWGLESSPAGSAFWQWGDDGEFKAFAIGSVGRDLALVVLTNGSTGLRVCREAIQQMLPGPHPALSFRMVRY